MMRPQPNSGIIELSPSSIENLADRLYSIGISNLTVIDHRDRGDLIVASRCLRRLLQAFEKEANRPLHTILLIGGA
jgi:hypothetical protein